MKTYVEITVIKNSETKLLLAGTPGQGLKNGTVPEKTGRSATLTKEISFYFI